MTRANLIARFTPIAIALLILPGCRHIGENAARLGGWSSETMPTMVLASGTKVRVRGRRAVISGVQPCPKTGLLDAARLAPKECIVIEKARTEVPLALYYLDSEGRTDLQEQRTVATVTRDPKKPGDFGLQLADGAYLQPE